MAYRLTEREAIRLGFIKEPELPPEPEPAPKPAPAPEPVPPPALPLAMAPKPYRATDKFKPSPVHEPGPAVMGLIKIAMYVAIGFMIGLTMGLSLSQ